MRTMKEIRQYVADRLAEHKSRQEALDAKLAELEAAIEADKQAQHTAAAANDAEGYARAVTDEGFHKVQLTQAQAAQDAPAFTPDELKALGEEITAVRAAAMAPLYARMVALREEGKALLTQAQKVFNDGYAVWSSCVCMKGGNAIPYQEIHPSVRALFGGSSHDLVLRSLSDTLNKKNERNDPA